MLCTRMRLTERRFRIKSTISYQIDGENESQATICTETRLPFVRPCAVLKMFDSDQSDGKESSVNSSRSSSSLKTISSASRKLDATENSIKSDTPGSQPSFDGSDDDVKQTKPNSGVQSLNRAPLIVVTLYLPSEAKTLAPVDVKRDLRRPPSFCQKFQRNYASRHCKCKENAKPDLMLCGKEITETSSNLCNSPPPNQDYEFLGSDDKTSDECTACSACMIEIERKTPPITAGLHEAAECSNINSYYMDSYGNLQKNLNIPFTEDIEIEHDDSPEFSTSIKSRPGSPDASPIIRITLNNKQSNEEHRKVEHRMVPSDDIDKATL